MGVCILEREHFITQVLREHVNNEETNKKLTLTKTNAKICHTRYLFHEFVNKHKEVLGEAVVTYMSRGYKKYGDKIAKFRSTVKVHKSPWKLRPVVSKCGTLLECISKWLDYKLQNLSKFMPTVIKDSKSLRDDIISLKLPPTAKLFTADAISMYTNIELNHAMQVMKYWLESLPDETKLHDFTPKVSQAILHGLNLVMRFNIMKFGDTFFLQKIGTAMGTSCAVIFANLYYAWHEKTVILPKYLSTHPDDSPNSSPKSLLLHRRFVDDIIGIWIGNEEESEHYIKDLSTFGILKWDCSKPTLTVNFLDMTISIQNSTISTKTYQKEGNPYLYINPNSAHPPSMIKGIIFGTIKRYFEQNSNKEDFISITKLFFQRLVARGWDPSIIKPIFISAFNKIKIPSTNKTTNKSPSPTARGQLFIHFIYHPLDIPRSQVRKIYEEELQGTIMQERNPDAKLTICYSRPKNIQDVLAKAALFEPEGKEVSKYITGELTTI